MGLRIKNFNIVEVPCKIQFLMGEGLGQFADLKKGLAKNGRGVFDWSFISQSTLWWQNFFVNFSWNVFWNILLKDLLIKFCKSIFYVSAVNCYKKVPTTNYLVFFSEYISRIAILTKASVIRHQKCFVSKKRFQ